MLTVNKLIPGARGLAAVLLKRASTVELDWDLRQKSRFEATDSGGRSLGVFLARGTVVRGGDVLVAEDGSLVVVKAAPQEVLVVRHCQAHGSAFDLLRAAYHLGNRHVALELQADRLQLEPDHVLAEMLRAMHLIVSVENVAFEPEAGAYAAHGGGTSHAHAEGHGHDHEHGPEQAPEPAAARQPLPAGKLSIPIAAAPAAHVHGPGCGHDHAEPHRH